MNLGPQWTNFCFGINVSLKRLLDLEGNRKGRSGTGTRWINVDVVVDLDQNGCSSLATRRLCACGSSLSVCPKRC